MKGQVSEVTGAATEASQHMVEQAQDMMTWALRVPKMSAPIADAGLEQCRRAVEATAQISAVYREAGERSAEDLQAMFACFGQFGQGLQRWQHACLDLTHHWIKSYGDKRGELLGVRSPMALAEAQRDIYLDAVGNMFAASTSLLQLAGKIVEDAVRPLQERARAAARR